jgi:quinol monooxygenase YgiN
MSGTLTLIATLKAKPGEEDRLRAELDAMVEPSLAEPGCLAYRPYVDANDPASMAIIEEWTDKAALDFHFTTPHFKQIVTVLEEILAEPFGIRLLVDAGIEL